jgi:hypothetical protein
MSIVPDYRILKPPLAVSEKVPKEHAEYLVKRKGITALLSKTVGRFPGKSRVVQPLSPPPAIPNSKKRANFLAYMSR